MHEESTNPVFENSHPKLTSTALLLRPFEAPAYESIYCFKHSYLHLHFLEIIRLKLQYLIQSHKHQ